MGNYGKVDKELIDRFVFVEQFLKDPLFCILLLIIYFNGDPGWKGSDKYYIAVGILRYMAKKPTFSTSIFSSLESVADSLYEGDENKNCRRILTTSFKDQVWRNGWDKGVANLQAQAKEKEFSDKGLLLLLTYLCIPFESAEAARQKLLPGSRDLLIAGMKARFGEEEPSS